jgi:hypothetical protein
MLLSPLCLFVRRNVGVVNHAKCSASANALACWSFADKDGSPSDKDGSPSMGHYMPIAGSILSNIASYILSLFYFFKLILAQ